MFDYGTVLCGESGGRVFYQSPLCTVFPYSETVFFGNGYHWDFYADHTYDQRYQPDAVGRQYGTPAVFKVSVYCIWCHDHGIYRGCKGSADFRRYNSTFVGCCFFRDACQYSAV